ncbi:MULTISPECIES: hypothetical protein [unclassified Pseudomonas]|uniref:hypothetical protein n=1 Tax=unclassified Pseudomonas TaxID=196821 RepID=UPI00128C155C|nr:MULTISPECIES: hypothetical protein [unclassified Pseudomonas]MPQ65523.1 hypothetical protein [Pseudomonas sp. MWU12-2323]
MRYLRMTAQDRSGNGRADTVLLRFYEEVPGKPDKLVLKAASVDMTADGVTDLQFGGDVNGDGRDNAKDEKLLRAFANQFLKLGWFNRGKSWQRYIKVFAENYHNDKSPNVVRLHLHEGTGTPRNQTLVFKASAHDTDNNGTLDSVVYFDVDGDGIVSRAEEEWIKSMGRTFLKFKWYS